MREILVVLKTTQLFGTKSNAMFHWPPFVWLVRWQPGTPAYYLTKRIILNP